MRIRPGKGRETEAGVPGCRGRQPLRVDGEWCRAGRDALIPPRKCNGSVKGGAIWGSLPTTKGGRAAEGVGPYDERRAGRRGRRPLRRGIEIAARGGMPSYRRGNETGRSRAERSWDRSLRRKEGGLPRATRLADTILHSESRISNIEFRIIPLHRTFCGRSNRSAPRRSRASSLRGSRSPRSGECWRRNG